MLVKTYLFTQSLYTDTGRTSPSANPTTVGARESSHWSVDFEVTGMTRPGNKIYGENMNRTHTCRRLAGLVVKASASGEENPGFKSRLRLDFSGSSHTSDWHYRVSAGTGRPIVTILRLGEVESLICKLPSQWGST